MGSPQERGNTSCNTPQPGTCGHAPHCGFRKWLGMGARLFTLRFGLAQKQIARKSSLFVCWPSTGDSQQAAGAHSGAVDAHSARILDYRTCLPRPLLAGPTLRAIRNGAALAFARSAIQPPNVLLFCKNMRTLNR
jgi:hypothetical protein